jgi:hypothetical protein
MKNVLTAMDPTEAHVVRRLRLIQAGMAPSRLVVVRNQKYALVTNQLRPAIHDMSYWSYSCLPAQRDAGTHASRKTVLQVLNTSVVFNSCAFFRAGNSCFNVSGSTVLTAHRTPLERLRRA